jgi:hypothetical protein
MRIRIIASLALAFAGVLALSLIRGQERPVASPFTPPPVPPPAKRQADPEPLKPVRDFAKMGLSDLLKQILFSGQQGAEWLYRMNGVKGRFLVGFRPDLDQKIAEVDDYLHQAGAAFALARAARVFGDERYEARASQALLHLLEETEVDPKDPKVRYCSLSPAVVNRLGAAGMLVLAIHELPRPQQDLLDKSEQLCNYIRRQARPDGSLRCNELAPEGQADSADAIAAHPGAALYALMRSQRHREAAWKTDLVRKAVAFYHPWWRAHKNMSFIPWQTAAYTEAFLKTKDKACADCVLEMNDWLCGLQYDEQDPRKQDPRKLQWRGGFKTWEDGHAVDLAPRVVSAACAESLADACRLAGELGDVNRHQRYGLALERTLQFLASLQYSESDTQHFKNEFRDSWLLGGFHASHQEGTLRIDYNQHAVSAVAQYLEHVIRPEPAR